MSVLKLAIIAVASLLLCAGCSGHTGQVSLAMSAHTGQAVVVTGFRMNGRENPLTPMVVEGMADTMRPHEGASRMVLGLAGGASGRIALEMEWVELSTGHAYRASVSVPIGDLERSASGGVEMMPVFAPGGEVVIASDPLPQSEADRSYRDVARTCGQRWPQADHDYRATPRELAGLYEAIEHLGPAREIAPCKP